jgi:hypothetical protein
LSYLIAIISEKGLSKPSLLFPHARVDRSGNKIEAHLPADAGGWAFILFAGISTKFANTFNIPYIGGNHMRISCTCGNTETLLNKMENFEIRLIRISEDSKTLVISVVCKLCSNETEKILIGN